MHHNNEEKLVNLNIKDFDAIVFDFDGVLTNNLVFITQDGKESVSCSRSDGLAFDVLRKLKISTFILSTEKNLVVSERAKKLQIPVIQGSKNKLKDIRQLAIENSFKFERLLYIGNDLNDYKAMLLCGYSACPSDSHHKIKKIANIVLRSQGGKGVAREIVEEVFNLDFIKILYN